MKIFFITFSFLLYSLFSFSQKEGIDSLLAKSINKERIKLNNDAFCLCLWHSYINANKADSLAILSIFLKDGSAAGYLETGAYDPDTVYHLIDSLARIWGRKVYKSINNSTLILMKCLDFYNSGELDDFVKSLDNKIDLEELKQRNTKQ